MINKNDIEQLFKAHYEQMFRLAVSLLHDEDLARDVVHDVFVSLIESSIDFLVSGGYLIKSIRNRCLNYIRDCEIHQRVANLLLIETEEYDNEMLPDDETIAHINDLIKTEIPPRARQVIELRFSDGLQFSKIANIMEISETAVYRHLSNALKIIRQKLNENGQI